jgi:acetylornithine/succinyldiaminopimelate/putrescine aminotransferase
VLRELFFRHLAQTSPEPPCLDIIKGQGIYLYDRSGKKYTDLISGISVSNTGHSNSFIVRAVEDQLRNYSHVMVYGEDILEPQVKLAAKLAELAGNNLDNVYFVNSGTEAVEGAVKLAKRYTGRPHVVSFHNCYHGSSHLCLSLMHLNPMNQSFRPLIPGVYRFPLNSSEAVDFIDERCACVIVEPIQGEGGALPSENKFLAGLRKKCNETGSLLIFDEVQTGMGRTGNWFAFGGYGITPDIVTLAKALGGGLPLGCFIAPKQIMQCLSNNPPLGHITTFGGNPISCSASLAAIQFIQDHKLIDTVIKKEEIFRSLLKHSQIKKITGKGLLLAVHLENEAKVKKVLTLLIQNGIVSDWFLFCDSALRISPPMIISESEIKEACLIILNALDRI